MGERRGGRVSLEQGGAARRALLARGISARNNESPVRRFDLDFNFAPTTRRAHAGGSICYRGGVGFDAHLF
jgi:hypothetical protein